MSRKYCIIFSIKNCRGRLLSHHKLKEQKMNQTLLKTELKTQKQTIIKTIGKRNGQVNTHSFTKELDRQ